MSRKGRKDDSIDPADESLPWWRRPGRGAVLSLLSLCGLLVAAVWTLEGLKARVDALPEYNPKPTIELMDVPRWIGDEKWGPQILAAIRLPERSHGSLVSKVGEQLRDSGWLSQVKRVAQDMDGTIRVWGEYRRPIAMVHTTQMRNGIEEEVYVAIDRHGFRLPEVYTDVERTGWIRILGVRSQAPDAGRRFEAEDAVAAIHLADLLFRQDFAHRILSIDVDNFRGRRDRTANHIMLEARNFVGKRIPVTWGSAIGEEFEEPPLEAKIRNIAYTLGPKGTTHVQANVSVFSDRVIGKVEPPIHTADSSRPRGR